MYKYILSIERIDTKNGCFYHQYDIPLYGVTDEDIAIREARKLRRCLKENYVVSISKVEKHFIGYITGRGDE